MISKSTENLVGNQSFVWFTGVVEDINDPLEMGRIRVRCFGYHTADKSKIPTVDLPWASVLMPVTSASMAEVGQSATGLLQGSWVVGFFRDGTSAQDPIIMGSVPAYTTIKNDNIGFSDPDKVHPIKIDVADNPIAAKSTFNTSYAYTKKNELRDLYNSVPLANDNITTWSLPDLTSIVNPQYPHNHVTAFENDANTVEYDSTEGSERFSHVHKSGTFKEISTNGDKTQVITGDNYKVIVKDDNVWVKGKCNLTIDNDCNTYVKGNWNIQVDGNKTEVVKGTYTLDAPTGSIDFPAGNITSNKVTLHTHTHSQGVDGDAPTPDVQAETNAPTSNT
jgi:hypothetical protein